MKRIKKWLKRGLITGVIAFAILWILGNPAPGSAMPIKMTTKDTPTVNTPWTATTPTVIAPNPFNTPCIRDASQCMVLSIVNLPGVDPLLLYQLRVSDMSIWSDNTNARLTRIEIECGKLSSQENKRATTLFPALRRKVLSVDRRIDDFWATGGELPDGRLVAEFTATHSAIPAGETIRIANNIMDVLRSYALCRVRSGPVLV